MKNNKCTAYELKSIKNESIGFEKEARKKCFGLSYFFFILFRFMWTRQSRLAHEKKERAYDYTKSLTFWNSWTLGWSRFLWSGYIIRFCVCAFLSFGEKITLCWLNCSFKFIFMVFGGFDVFFTSGYLFCYNNRTFLPQVKKNRMFESSKRMVYEKKHATDFFHLPQHTYTRTQTSIMFLAL